MGWLGDFFNVALTVVSALVMPELLIVVKLIGVILEKLGLTDKTENPQEMGDKMLQAEEQGIKPENFANYEDYNKAIDNFELDPSKSGLHTDKEKLEKYAAVKLAQIEQMIPGITTLMTEIVPKLSQEFNIDKKVESYIEGFKNNLDDVSKYFKGELSDKTANGIEKQLMDIERKLNPQKSEMDVYKELSKERSTVQEKL